MEQKKYSHSGACNILILFVSTVVSRSLNDPPQYVINGKTYKCVQTNESAFIYCREMLGGKAPDKIFLIVSQTVKTGKIDPKDERLSQMTHLDYVQDKIREIYAGCGLTDSTVEILDYRDDLDEAVVELSETAGKLAAITKEYAGKQIYLHADMTGGFRHAAMMMLSIVQLTKFLGIQTGEILYSDMQKNTVYVANKVHAMFELISGADEFAQFGSVNALNKYFNTNKAGQSKELKKLLKTMERFSTAIRLCHPDFILSSVRSLSCDLQKFKRLDYEKLSPEERTFSQLLQRVEQEYKPILQVDVPEFEFNVNIIRWCLDKEYWQQALTFATERLSRYIVEFHIFEPQDIENWKRENKGKGESWQLRFCTAWITEKDDKKRREKRINREADRLSALRFGKAVTKYPDRHDDIVRLLAVFDEVRRERNNTHHAGDRRGDPNASLADEIEKIKRLINDCLNRIQSFVQ